MTSSIQLWSVREAVSDSGWEAALRRLAALGFTQVEPFAIHLTASDVAGHLRELGLTTPTAHGFLDAENLVATLDAAEVLGARTVIHPHLGEQAWSDADAIAETARMLRDASARAADRGIRVGIHNHDFELLHQVDGQAAFWALVDQLPSEVCVEFDIYWAAIARRPIADDVVRLADRATVLHIKDGPIGGAPEDQVALGDGDLPLDEILNAAPGALPVLSLDRMAGTPDDIWRAVERSADWLARGVRL